MRGFFALTIAVLSVLSGGAVFAADTPGTSGAAPSNAPAAQSAAGQPKPPAGNMHSQDAEYSENTVSQPSTAGGDPSSAESLLKLRDPFKRPDSVMEDAAPKSDLEAFASHQFQLVGIMTGPKNMRAIIQAPNGKTFFVKKGDHIGQRKGLIERISPEKVVVQEKIVNVLGQAENITTEIKINLSGKIGLSVSPGPGQGKGGSAPKP